MESKSQQRRLTPAQLNEETQRVIEQLRQRMNAHPEELQGEAFQSSETKQLMQQLAVYTRAATAYAKQQRQSQTTHER